jgi:hypothetical protein
MRFRWGIGADSEIICAVRPEIPMSIRTPAAIGVSIVLVVLVAFLRYLGLIGLLIFKSGPTTAAQTAGHDSANSTNVHSPALPRARHFNQQQMKVLETRLKPFGSQRFWIIAETGEYAPQAEKWRFGQQLQQALVQAGWITSQKVRQRMGIAGFKETRMYPYSRGGDNGLVIFAAPDSISAGTALNIVINEMSFGSSVETDDNLRNAILIFVGAQ